MLKQKPDQQKKHKEMMSNWHLRQIQEEENQGGEGAARLSDPMSILVETAQRRRLWRRGADYDAAADDDDDDDDDDAADDDDDDSDDETGRDRGRECL